MALGPKSSETLLGFSDSAVRKLKSIQQEEGNPNLMLRVSVYGGGCSGFQYTFSLDEEAKPTDRMVEKDGATLIIDQMSYQYLAGSEVDFSEGLEGAMFVVNNPNATSTCGCGASFSI
ncbi:MAG: iron-sulfur cluster insertion protein ErpA [Gammaproteobacteria bacterium]|nr:iron-sulfur cluster insertion protein ErpA [Gammaproteobacteria bacterium]MDH3536681.1 iron-sulfur cluster insertion protein ErpA [Gammaproteobacteria bacterium]